MRTASFSKERGQDLTQRLAGYLLSIEEGEHLLTVRELAKKFEASLGSISNALYSLEQSGYVRINQRGHLGSFLEYHSMGDLWNVARNEPFVFANPLPSNRRYEGLAGGLKSLMERAGLVTYVIFTRGSLPRIETLRNYRCHVAVMSMFAANGLCTEKESIVLTLPPGSFLGGHRVFYRPEAEYKPGPLRVGLDLTSYDHIQLTKMEFADQNVQFVVTNAVQTRRLLVEGVIDAAVWTVDDMVFQLTPEILERPLSERVLSEISDTDQRAALVIRSDDVLVQKMIYSNIEKEWLLSFIESVAIGKTVAEY